jgi:protein TonB
MHPHMRSQPINQIPNTMEKRSNSIEKARPVMFTAGLAFAWACTLTAFEYRTAEPLAQIPDDRPIEVFEQDELPPVVKLETHRPQPPSPVRPSLPQPTAAVTVVQTDVPTQDDPEIPDPEAGDPVPEPVGGIPVIPDPEVDEFILVPEVMPAYPGGDRQLLTDLSQRVEYPDEARTLGISGVVYVQYVVNKKGEVTDVKVVRGVDPFLDREAVRVVKTLKGYTPGRQAGRTVNVPFTMPIRFVLKS